MRGDALDRTEKLVRLGCDLRLLAHHRAFSPKRVSFRLHQRLGIRRVFRMLLRPMLISWGGAANHQLPLRLAKVRNQEALQLMLWTLKF